MHLNIFNQNSKWNKKYELQHFQNNIILNNLLQKIQFHYSKCSIKMKNQLFTYKIAHKNTTFFCNFTEVFSAGPGLYPSYGLSSLFCNLFCTFFFIFISWQFIIPLKQFKFHWAHRILRIIANNYYIINLHVRQSDLKIFRHSIFILSQMFL